MKITDILAIKSRWQKNCFYYKNHNFNKNMTNKQTEETNEVSTEDFNPVEDKKGGLKRSRKDEKLNKQLEEKTIELAEAKDKYLRLFAEFDNFKKRTVKEKLDFMKSAGQETIIELLPVLDDFERAKKSSEDENSKEPFSEGVNLVYAKLFNILKVRGLQAMESTGAEFNPEFHEAITKIPASSEEMKGKVIDTIQTGYKLHDKIIRHPKVIVGE